MKFCAWKQLTHRGIWVWSRVKVLTLPQVLSPVKGVLLVCKFKSGKICRFACLYMCVLMCASSAHRPP